VTDCEPHKNVADYDYGPFELLRGEYGETAGCELGHGELVNPQ